VRWGALAFASIAVPLAIVASTLSQAVAPPSIAPGTIEVTRLAALDAPAAPPAGDASPALNDPTALPAYFFVDWAAECDTSCPTRGEF
jgi:hypothetical protein